MGIDSTFKCNLSMKSENVERVSEKVQSQKVYDRWSKMRRSSSAGWTSREARSLKNVCGGKQMVHMRIATMAKDRTPRSLTIREQVFAGNGRDERKSEEQRRQRIKAQKVVRFTVIKSGVVERKGRRKSIMVLKTKEWNRENVIKSNWSSAG
jgi:hypothetical protein